MQTLLTPDCETDNSYIQISASSSCEIVRVAVPDMESAKALKEIKRSISIPLVADIHFDHKLAIASIPYVDKLRINPGNMGKGLKEVVEWIMPQTQQPVGGELEHPALASEIKLSELQCLIGIG